MALDIWTIKSGHSFGTFEERTIIDIPLPVTTTTGITFSVISGQLPTGLRIHNGHIIGTPYTIPRSSTFLFCIRASNSEDSSDRTFKITINNTEIPIFVTPAGKLPLGPNEQYFAIADTYVDFQLDVSDLNVGLGKTLTFFIANDGGTLPPGLILTDLGRIVGFIQPVLSILKSDGNGNYDTGAYDNVAYDFGYRPTNGYDSFIYDGVFYDYFIVNNRPKQLNRNYQFIVSVTDGDSIVTRMFSIFVVGDDYFKADNNILLDGTGLFTADSTYLTSPVWITPSKLGVIRANNYAIFPIQLYDGTAIICNKELVNADVLASTSQIQLSDNQLHSQILSINHATQPPSEGQYLSFDGLFAGATSSIYQITNVLSIDESTYRLQLDKTLEFNVPDNVRFTIGSLSTLPPGLDFNQNNNEIYGYVPYQPAVTKTYNFTIQAVKYSLSTTEISRSWRKFTIDIIGEIDSLIQWTSGPDLGSIPAGYISNLKIYATPVKSNNVVVYELISGFLPTGLSLSIDGEIIGKVRQDSLTYFDITLDNDTTSIDRQYKFTVNATVLFGYGEILQEFTLTITTPSEIQYSNVTVKPYLPIEKRRLWNEFIDNINIFTPTSIYRSNDPNFGIQKSLSMLIYAGIETTNAAKYISAIGLNHKKKRFNFNGIKKAIAYDKTTHNPIYEIVYMSMIDPLEPNGMHLPHKLTYLGKDPETIKVDESLSIWSTNISDLSFDAPFSTRPANIITADNAGYVSSDPHIATYYPSSITNWRENISMIGSSERNFLPLWMRSIQPGSKTELDFQLAVPICYCKPGTADTIILNIKYSEFDFTLIDYTIDRYTIDSVEGSAVDKYLVFRNDRINV